MKRYLSIPVLITYMLLSGVNFAQQDDAMMKAWQESMNPGPMHEILAKGVGEWNVNVTSWMDPAQPPMTSTGTSKGEMIFDGKYFHSTFTGTFMNQPFTGLEVSGYDNVKKEFFTLWIDNMGTGVMHLTGAYDEMSKSITYTGTVTDPTGTECKVREVMQYPDDYTMLYEMYMEKGGQPEFKAMEIRYTKVR